MYNNIDIPLFIEIEENGLENISEMLKRSNIYINNALIITDKGKSAEFALIVKEELSISDSMIYYVEDNTYEQVKAVEDFARKSKADVLIGVGGGLALDISIWDSRGKRVPLTERDAELINRQGSQF